MPKGVTFLAPSQATGKDNNSPSIVPRHAIRKVSNAGNIRSGIILTSKPMKYDNCSKIAFPEPIRCQSVSKIIIKYTLKKIMDIKDV